LFPGRESDFFRDRLTHSLEVAQIGKSIAIKINHDLKSKGLKYQIDTDLVEFAGLAHDLGHPPFGHFGENILDRKMIECGGFESNAQTLRLITKIEKRHNIDEAPCGFSSSGQDIRVGLNLAARSIASILKYDEEIPFEKDDRITPKKGFYRSERDIVNAIKEKVCGKKFHDKFKTVECWIMDIADDIAYSTYDLEDSFKAGFLKPIDLICANETVLENVAKKVNEKSETTLSREDVREEIHKIFLDVFILPEGFEEAYRNPSREDLEELHLFSIRFAHIISGSLASNPRRTDLTSSLVGGAIRKVGLTNINDEFPALSIVELEPDKKIQVEILKNLVYESQIMSPKIQMVAYRSQEIIETIFKTLAGKNGFRLLPEDFQETYKAAPSPQDKKRVICDFIAGMTDRYAIEFYGRLTSENPETIFKPI